MLVTIATFIPAYFKVFIQEIEPGIVERVASLTVVLSRSKRIASRPNLLITSGVMSFTSRNIYLIVVSFSLIIIITADCFGILPDL